MTFLCRGRWRALLALYMAFALPLHLLPVKLPAQAGGVEVVYTGPDEYQITRPMACPLGLTGGFLGNFFGYEYAGYEWTDDWQRDRVLDPVHHSIAEYVPRGDPYFIVSRDDRARWIEPRITVRCTITEWWSGGRIQRTLARFKTIAHGGTVQECGSGGGSSWELKPNPAPYDSNYDPYADHDAISADGMCGDGSTEEASTGETVPTGNGTQYQPGDNTGGETVDWGTGIGNGGTSVCGTQAVVEYVCIDIFDPETGTWGQWSCGYATTC